MDRLTFSRSGSLLLLATLALTGCVSTPPYVYHYIPGRTATLENGYAVAPHSRTGRSAKPSMPEMNSFADLTGTAVDTRTSMTLLTIVPVQSRLCSIQSAG